MIPCKKDKCLKYPACKHKTFIICTLLRIYCDDIIHSTNSDTDVWYIIYDEFPELLGVKLETPPKGSNITIVHDTLFRPDILFKPKEFYNNFS